MAVAQAVDELTKNARDGTWDSWDQVPSVITYLPHLRKTVAIALVVGTAFFAMNQLGMVLAGAATPVVWVKAVLTYLVPFCVSNYGILTASHRSLPGPTRSASTSVSESPSGV